MGGFFHTSAQVLLQLVIDYYGNLTDNSFNSNNKYYECPKKHFVCFRLDFAISDN